MGKKKKTPKKPPVEQPQGDLLAFCVKFLSDYGYIKKSEADKIKSFEDVALKSALAKYQRFDANVASFKESTGEELLADGEFGPATWLAMRQPRCGYPDMVDGEELPAIGTGGWRGCITQGEHGAIVDVDMSTCPSYWRNVLLPVMRNNQTGYAGVGLLLIFRDDDTNEDLLIGGPVNGPAQTKLTWTKGQGWIGLAMVGPFQCSDNYVWLKLDNRYGSTYDEQLAIIQLTALLAHELGHNCGMRHHPSGIMRASIENRPELPWHPSDPATNTVKRLYGGDPVDIPGAPDPDPPGPVPPGEWPGVRQPVSSVFTLANGTKGRIYREFG